MAGAKITDFELDKYNQVGQDQIWRDLIAHEAKTARYWRSSWGFVQEHYKDLFKSLEEKKRISETKETTQIVQDLLLMSQRRSGVADVIAATEPPPEKKMPPCPPTTYAEYGRLGTNRDYQLEIYGPYSRSIKHIQNRFEWPLEGCP